MNLVQEKIFSKIARPILSRFNHSRFISQDFFRATTKLINKEYGTGTSIFIPSHMLINYLDEIPKNTQIVIAGASDYGITQEEYIKLLNYPRRVKFFIQNLNFPESESIFLLPIGIEDLRWARAGMPWNFGISLIIEKKAPRILVGPFAQTHPSRLALEKEVGGLDNWDVLTKRISSWDYARIASKYAMIACPRGNGLDTHRFWESIYRGSVPIVLESTWSENLKKYAVPHFSVTNWSVDVEKIHSVLFKPSFPGYLYPEWWVTRFINLINQ